MKTGIIFDMDGTLWDSSENVAKSWNELLADKNINIHLTKEDIMGQMGKVMNEIADNLLTSVDVPERYAILDECGQYENEYLGIHGGELYEGVEDVFRLLAMKYELYIVSNCQKGYIETFLKYYNLEQYIRDFEDFGNTGLPKADNIRMVIERNHLDHAFYVGDTKGDMRASDKAGSIFIHAAYGFDTMEENRPAVQDIRDLPALLERLTKA